MTYQPKENPIKTFEDLADAIQFFEFEPTTRQADIVQNIGLELLARGKLEAWEFKLLCTNLFDFC